MLIDSPLQYGMFIVGAVIPVLILLVAASTGRYSSLDPLARRSALLISATFLAVLLADGVVRLVVWVLR